VRAAASAHFHTGGALSMEAGGLAEMSGGTVLINPRSGPDPRRLA
jgi:hypothetical protein